MPARAFRFGIKAAQMGGSYAQIRDAWMEADRLGFDTGWLHDHLLNQNDVALPEEEGWTILTALLVETRRIRGGLMVTANTFRHPGVLAKIATTLDRIPKARAGALLARGYANTLVTAFAFELIGPKELQFANLTKERLEDLTS